ncbi:MAG: hypothetical protein JXI33_07015 [Candidatus Aminicenantes bacterium]|nr:hypothetical protein [Candidatus Aminicenantes bacterium]
MIKKQQKWIALFVALTFIWLMQLSTMPVAAAGTSTQAGVARSEQGPDYFEAIGQKAAPAKKKSMLPWILIGVGAITITAVVLFLVVLKTNYDIRGDWNVSRTTTGTPYTFTTKFIGEKASGTFDAMQSGTLLHGTYTVDKKNVVWTFSSGSRYSGTFSDKDTMSGPYLRFDGTTTGTWTATRAATATALPVMQSQKEQPDRD